VAQLNNTWVPTYHTSSFNGPHFRPKIKPG